ncbi:MAG: signal transduction histidine kinase [Halioglobus sp.]|jgi:signal transduction histidine kinase
MLTLRSSCNETCSGLVSQTAFASALLLLFWLHAPGVLAVTGEQSGPRDITATFQILHSPWGTYTDSDFFEGSAAEGLQALDPPANVSRPGDDAWLFTTLDPSSASILEIPGQLFNFVEIWFRLPDGQVIYDRSGDRYPYSERTVKHANVAFPIPRDSNGPLDVLIRMKNVTSHPMHFAAWAWPEESWQDYVLAQRAWYGLFLGAIIILCIYNSFLAIMLRDPSYFYYVGYVLCLTFSVILCSGLAEEFLWPSGKPSAFILAATGLGTFLMVGFANSFLKIRDRYPYMYWVSTALCGLALVLGLMTIFTYKLPLLPEDSVVSIVHGLMVVGALYFITISIGSYFMGFVQARFLALSMLALLPSAVIYFLYTSAIIPYNLFVGHFLEFGALAEGLILSLALADRINLISGEKVAAERLAREYQVKFSRAVINTQEHERQVLSEKMHDSIGHGLLVLRNNLQECSDTLPKTGNEAIPAQLLGEQIEYCGEIMGEVRGISHDLHPHMLERLGLSTAIESTIQRALATSGIDADIDIDDLPADIDPDVEITVYRVIQECLNNILKYSEATTVVCRIFCAPTTLEVQVADNGKGFKVDGLDGKTLGLLEMEGRIHLLGGHLEVTSLPGKGTEVQFGIPYSVQLVENS